MLLVYGVLILASGIAEFAHPPNTVLANLHAPIWWGALLTVLGVIYSYYFRPKSARRDGEKGGPGSSTISSSKGGR